MDVEPDFLKSQIAFNKFCVKLGNEQQIFFEQGADGITESMGYEPELKVNMDVDEVLDRVMITAKRKNLVY